MTIINEILDQADALTHADIGLIVDAIVEEKAGYFSDVKIWLRDIALGDGTDTEARMAAILLGVLSVKLDVTRSRKKKL